MIGAMHTLPRLALFSVLATCLLGGLAEGATRPAAPAIDLTGEWTLNASASQALGLPDPPRRGPPDDRPLAAQDSVLPDPPARSDEAGPRRPRPRAPAWLVRPERLEALRALLGETRSLSVVQTPTYVDLRGDMTSRSLEIGAESQVSLPTGELADQKVRWRGDRLIVSRRVPRGVKVVETYRRLPATDQLEVTVRRSGGPDDGLGKLELRRVFDRDGADGPARAAPGPHAASSEAAP
jgi:hypothetical protein